METKIQIIGLNDKVLFEHECKNNSIQNTLKVALDKGIDLSGARLNDIVLTDINMSNANLSYAIFSNCILNSVNFYGANLNNAKFEGAHLIKCNMKEANLCNADLSNAILNSIWLTGANLYKASLKDSVLLNDVSIYGANMFECNLSGVHNLPTIPMTCPDHSIFNAWKIIDDCIIELAIPTVAKRLSTYNGRCRADKVYVISIYDMTAKCHIDKVVNTDYGVYEVETIVEIDNFDTDRNNDEGNGIYFFLDKQEAIEYNEDIKSLMI